MATEVDNTEQQTEIPEDYKAFQAYRDTGELPEPSEAPAEGDENTPPSEPAKEAGQTAEGSDPEEEPEQENEDQAGTERHENTEPRKGARLNRRMRELTGEIKALKSQLAELTEQPEEEEATAEAVSAPEPAAEAAALTRPMLRDFEDTESETAWDQYERAMDEYNQAKTAAQVTAALTAQKDKLELEHARTAAQEAWDRAASRFPDYNEVVRAEVKISAAMESVMRMDPEAGTELAYYLGQHPDESERIAKITLANNAEQWTTALARAGVELGAIRAKLPAPGSKPAAAVTAKAAPAAQPQPKKVTGASRPPSQIRGGTVPPSTDVMSDEDAANYKKWKAAREAQLKRK